MSSSRKSPHRSLPSVTYAKLLLLHLRMAIDGDVLFNLHDTAEKGIIDSNKRLEKVSGGENQEYEQMLIDDECQLVEELIGWSFVAAQSHVTQVVARLLRLSRYCEKTFNKRFSFLPSDATNKVWALSSPLSSAYAFTEIEVINGVANYWKHHEQWETKSVTTPSGVVRIWVPEKKNFVSAQTIAIVSKFGLSPVSTGNLRTAAEAFGVEAPYSDLGPIRQKAEAWGQIILKRATKEVETFCIDFERAQEP